MRPPQDREVDPSQSKRLQARTDAPAQNVVRQQRCYYSLGGKDPPLAAAVGQSGDPSLQPLENLYPDADLTNFIRLGWVNVTLIPRPLHSNRSLLEQIAVS